MQCACTILSSVVCLALYFSTLSHKRQDFRGEKSCMYVCRFQNVVLRCPTPRLYCFLSFRWPSFRFLSFMAFLVPSIQFFFGLPRALFVFLACVIFPGDGVLAHRPNTQPGGPVYLSLSGCSPLTYSARVALPAATLRPA